MSNITEASLTTTRDYHDVTGQMLCGQRYVNITAFGQSYTAAHLILITLFTKLRLIKLLAL